MSTTEIGPPTQDSGQATSEPSLPTSSPITGVSGSHSTRSTLSNNEYETQRFFEGSASPPPAGSAFTKTGVLYKETKSTGVPAVIPEKTLSFKFTAVFERCEPGQYVVQWHVNFLENLSIPSGLRLSVNVSYDARVELALFNNDSIKRCENSGLQVDFVQFRPITIAYTRP
ncbi:hypothetical protein BGX34_005677, partial [Mortierella sp. NVP85]